jgi:3-oxoacyl-[acyl-carrier protein] reductase
MDDRRLVLITGTRKGIGRHLAQYYLQKGCTVIGCSREPVDEEQTHYEHHVLDVADEGAVKAMFADVRRTHRRLDVLLNNAGIASMNHALLTPMDTAERIFRTNVLGSFLFAREAAKLMRKSSAGRIVNFTTVASPLRLEGEAIYAASKAAIERLTQILAREFAEFGITVNAVGPTPVKTDLVKSVPEKKLQELIDRQAIRRFGEVRDITNVIDFFLQPQSDFVTGQIVYLGGVG